MTGNSLRKLSLAKRISQNTMRRPIVKLKTRNRAMPPTCSAIDAMSSLPCPAMPKVTAMITQPIVSSMIAEATMVCPTSRLRKFISRMMVATILTDEIDSAVPRNSEGISRPICVGRMLSGSSWPRPKPSAKGTRMPVAEIDTAARPTLRTSCRSVSIPVSRSSIRMPSCDRALIIACCSGDEGNTAFWMSGSKRPNTLGPRTMPARSCPMIAGWPIRTIASPSPRPTRSSRMSWATKMLSARPLPDRAAASAGVAASVRAGTRISSRPVRRLFDFKSKIMKSRVAGPRERATGTLVASSRAGSPACGWSLSRAAARPATTPAPRRGSARCRRSANARR